jgi:hypothetical protein
VDFDTEARPVKKLMHYELENAGVVLSSVGRHKLASQIRSMLLRIASKTTIQERPDAESLLAFRPA